MEHKRPINATMGEIDKEQYKFALEALWFWYNLMVSILSLLATAGIALIGFSAHLETLLLFLFAGFVPVAMIIVVVVLRLHMSPFICIAVNIEQKYNINDGIVSTYIDSVFGRDSFLKVRRAIETANIDLAEKARRANRATFPDFARYITKYLTLQMIIYAMFATVVFLLI